MGDKLAGREANGHQWPVRVGDGNGGGSGAGWLQLVSMRSRCWGPAYDGL